VTLAQAQDDLAGIGRRLRDQYPDSHATDTGIRTVPLHEEVTGRSGPMLRILFVAVILVLLIACANLASLFLVRGTSHRQELALRTALGASRARIAGHVLSEVLILGVIGGALGLFVARTLVEVMISNAPAALPRVAEVGIDVPAALFTLALSLGTSLVAGLCRRSSRRGAAYTRLTAVPARAAVASARLSSSSRLRSRPCC
jgi:ABC-type antimicrobial peptide transport system permease subunit